MIANYAGDVVIVCEVDGCSRTQVLVPFGMATNRSPRSLASGWVFAGGKDHCPACVRDARSYRELQFDRFGPYPVSELEPVVSVPHGLDVSDMRMQIMFMVAHARRPQRVASAFLVLYSHSCHVRMHHRSIALGIIDATGDPLIDKGST